MGTAHGLGRTLYYLVLRVKCRLDIRLGVNDPLGLGRVLVHHPLFPPFPPFSLDGSLAWILPFAQAAHPSPLPPSACLYLSNFFVTPKPKKWVSCSSVSPALASCQALHALYPVETALPPLRVAPTACGLLRGPELPQAVCVRWEYFTRRAWVVFGGEGRVCGVVLSFDRARRCIERFPGLQHQRVRPLSPGDPSVFRRCADQGQSGVRDRGL